MLWEAMSYEPSPDLEDALGELKDAPVPKGLTDEVIGAVRTQRRYLGLHPKEWAVIGVSAAIFIVVVQLLIWWGFGE